MLRLKIIFNKLKIILDFLDTNELYILQIIYKQKREHVGQAQPDKIILYLAL